MNYSTEQSSEQLANLADPTSAQAQVSLKAIEAKQFNFDGQHTTPIVQADGTVLSGRQNKGISMRFANQRV